MSSCDPLLVTYMHTLISNAGVPAGAQLTNDIAKFNKDAITHENHVIDLLQKHWSPRFATEPGDYQEQLDDERSRREDAFKKDITALEQAETIPLRKLAKQIANED